MSVKTVIVDQAPKRVIRAREKEFRVMITQAPVAIGDHYEAVAYVGDAKISVYAHGEGVAWSELKAAVKEAGGNGTVALSDRKKITDISDNWKSIKAAAAEDAEEAETESAPSETPVPEGEQAAGGQAAGGQRSGGGRRGG